MYTPVTSSLRFIEPKVEIYTQDRRSGAYPTKVRTGDRTRNGRNAYFFDDSRTVMFLTGVNVNLPTTFRVGSTHLANDLTSSITSTGNVKSNNVDQWLAHHAQDQAPGPFNESYLFEQTEVNLANSTFMTGSAYIVAPERFKSKLANKTIIRLEIPLTAVSQLTPSSSLHYLNPVSGGFIKVINDELSLTTNGGAYPSTFAPIPFTPYGMHYLPLNDSAAGAFGASSEIINAQTAYRRITTYQGDGTDVAFYSANLDSGYTPVTASVLNPLHRASVSQSLKLSDHISHPFLLEKAVVEMPFAAGPGWLNDRFGIREILQDDLTYTIDAGGPMITFALMRQDKDSNAFRDIITSGTITNALDMTTGSYTMCSAAYAGIGGYTDVIFTPEGLGWFANPSVVITGSALSGSTNMYTGSVRLILEPQVTSHVWRLRASGSATFYYNIGNSGATAGSSRATRADGITFGPIARRSSKYLGSGRSILGNQFALIDSDDLNGANNPVKAMDTQNENLAQDSVAPRFYKSKIYHDVVSATTKSPYLLYPEDDLLFCLSKHRAVGAPLTSDWNITGADRPVPSRLVAYHDVKIPTGTLRITLYGDLIKEDKEFHDTLNQRLETVELWETVGLEPTLDQFDVTYRNELSGSYLDRFNVLNVVNNSLQANLSASRETQQYYGNFNDITNTGVWSTQYAWSKARRVHELQKSSRATIHQSTSEIFWDTRILNPGELVHQINPTLVLAGYDTGAGQIQYGLTTGTEFWGPDLAGSIHTTNGIKDWGMRFPFEPRNPTVTQQFSDTLATHIFRYKLPGVSTIVHSVLNYNDLTYEVGSGSLKLFAGETSPTDSNVSGMRKSEFLKAFFGIGTGRSSHDNQHVTYYRKAFPVGATAAVNTGVNLRGWRYGMMSAFPTRNVTMFRRDRYGQFRDMLEQRLDSKFFDNDTVTVREGPVQVNFYDRDGNLTDADLTLSSNLSYEVTSSLPYFDGVSRNRGTIDYSALNISSVVF